MNIIQNNEQHSHLSPETEYHFKVDVKCEPDEIGESELKDLKGEECFKLELYETSVNMTQCISPVKCESDDRKLEDQELIIKDEENVDHELFDAEVEKSAWSFDNRSSSGDSRKCVRVRGGRLLFGCIECGFQSKRKYDIKRHTLVHRDPSQIEMFKCDQCNYQSNQRWSLKRHMLVHRDPLHVQMFRCNECRYETKHKHSLKQHMLVHKDPSETEIFKCHECNYQCKHKSSLKRHMMLHIDAPEVQVRSQLQMFKCNECNYQCKRKRHLKQHVLVHKDAGTLEMFKCDQCNHRSKSKGNLKRHMAVHKKRKG